MAQVTTLLTRADLEIILLPFMAKNQTTSTKFQINSKFEISMTETK